MGAARNGAVARVAERGYWREDDARVVVEAWRRSGQGLTEFARQYGVHPRRLSRWAERLGDSGEDVRFHPVRLVTAEVHGSSGPGAPLEIVLGGEWSVRVFPGFAAEDLARVLTVLEGAC
jgi:hypothetical protein